MSTKKETSKPRNVGSSGNKPQSKSGTTARYPEDFTTVAYVDRYGIKGQGIGEGQVMANYAVNRDKKRRQSEAKAALQKAFARQKK